MGIQAGLVGLPNVGKSTLFNALTKSSIPAENYPFCTIDPHIAITFVPDKRLENLLSLYRSQKSVPATVTFVDIAGLVKGAASGEGLGNQFLSHIREVDLILHVLRCFEDPDIVYHGATIDPLEDYHIITSELMLKDIDSVIKRLERLERMVKAAQNKPAEQQELITEQSFLKQVHAALERADFTAVQKLLVGSGYKHLQLLCAKPFLIIANVSEGELDADQYQNNVHYKTLVNQFGANRVIPVSARAESELSQLSEVEAEEMMGILGMTKRGLDRVIEQTYAYLGLITFFTCGPQEAHAWPIPTGLTVRQAAGYIHSDLEKGFICAEVYNYKDIVKAGSEAKVKEQGLLRIEGQNYLIQDGDIIHVRFNV